MNVVLKIDLGITEEAAFVVLKIDLGIAEAAFVFMHKQHMRKRIMWTTSDLHKLSLASPRSELHLGKYLCCSFVEMFQLLSGALAYR